jgi:hypothetical protein
MVTARVAHALEKLRHDCARIAAGTVQQSVGNRCQQGAQVFFVGLLKDGQHGPEREAQVGSGIAVRHREHVDLVEQLLVVDDPVNAGNQCLGKAVAGQLCRIRGVQAAISELLARQQKAGSAVVQDDALGSNFLHDRPLGEA